MQKEYIIIGDTEKYDGCLIVVCGSNEEHAESILSRMLNNPNENDLRMIEGHTNIRLAETEKENCWWRF